MTEEEWQEAVDAELASRGVENVQDSTRYNNAQNTDNVKAMLLAEAEKIKQRVPDFDFVRMLKEDPEFRERILKGYSVEEAYFLSNRKKTDAPAPKKRMDMRENGRNNFKGSAASRNVSNMSDEEFKKYINSIKGSKF